MNCGQRVGKAGLAISFAQRSCQASNYYVIDTSNDLKYTVTRLSWGAHTFTLEGWGGVIFSNKLQVSPWYNKKHDSSYMSKLV